MSQANLTISAVLPVRNQAGTVAAAVAECLATIGHHCADYEIILVDDGSSDGTSRQVDYLAAAHAPVMVLHQPEPRGYAAALRAAWQVARGDYILAADISRPAGIAELPRLLAVLGDSAAVVGYRARPPRRLLAPLYAAAVRAVFDTDLRDPALHVALFRADLAGFLPDEVPDGLAHAEIYARAKHAGLPVAQVAISGRRGKEPSPGSALIELAGYRPPSRGRQGALLGTTALIVATSLWLLRQRQRPSLAAPKYDS